ncbi:MAG: hypothetical protein KAU24_01310 [Candidatus Aenigmarchaeota archaeon]|nr:hypothetical protein [Candidatus Aenigmarchaeota archaeon]
MVRKITARGLAKHDGDEIFVWREKGKYNLAGKLDYQVIEGRDFFFVEAKNDGCILKKGDRAGFQYKSCFRTYDVDL